MDTFYAKFQVQLIVDGQTHVCNYITHLLTDFITNVHPKTNQLTNVDIGQKYPSREADLNHRPKDLWFVMIDFLLQSSALPAELSRVAC